MPNAMPSAVPMRAVRSVPRDRALKSSGLGSASRCPQRWAASCSFHVRSVPATRAVGHDDSMPARSGDLLDRVEADDCPLEVRRIGRRPAAGGDRERARARGSNLGDDRALPVRTSLNRRSSRTGSPPMPRFRRPQCVRPRPSPGTLPNTSRRRARAPRIRVCRTASWRRRCPSPAPGERRLTRPVVRGRTDVDRRVVARVDEQSGQPSRAQTTIARPRTVAHGQHGPRHASACLRRPRRRPIPRRT